ncbi:MAG: CvpA family protein [Candidatus Cloacimonetes bacterium]|jgi:membrane protein required for colicin V production|nr:CvpA family protein [Candidatus Cloacimonadota bacterium]MDY0299387.1 CvpA family protein [Candidatus Cloacimonadaceae bacterium]MCB5277899.1 CvpA family protein [Candidatus Cloacimonadota bacterium]MCK9332459.1 CvpA family protein [Candidatus Cloacimonadota bacterium]MDD2210738.1 CvpA family protein [Candidatus Cloacimonadota bacterium]
MGVIDWIILAVLLFFTVVGIRRGLVGAVVQFAGAVLAFFLVGHYYPLLANQLMLKYGLGKTISTIIAVVLILILIVVIVRFVLWILERFIKALNLSWLNRTVGGILGLVNGLILVIIFTVLMDYMPKLSEPLKDGEKHRVYVGVEQLKEELFAKLNLKNRIKYIKMPEFLQQREDNEE